MGTSNTYLGQLRQHHFIFGRRAAGPPWDGCNSPLPTGCRLQLTSAAVVSLPKLLTHIVLAVFT